MGFSLRDFAKGAGSLLLPGGGALLAAEKNPEIAAGLLTGGLAGGALGYGVQSGDIDLNKIKQKLGSQPVGGTGFSGLPQSQQDLLNSIYGQAGGMVGQGPSQAQLSAQAGLADPSQFQAQQQALGGIGQIDPALRQTFGGISAGGPTAEQQQTFGALNQGIGPLQAGGLQQTAQGGGFNNPYLEAQFKRGSDVLGEQFSNIIRPGIEARFARSGRLGSPAEGAAGQSAERAVGRSLTDFATGIFGPAAEAERGRQFAAQGLLPQLGLQQQGLGLQQRGQAFGAAGQLAQQGMQGGLNQFNAAQALQAAQRAGGLDRFSAAGQLAQQQQQNLLNQFNVGTSLQNQPFAQLGQLANIGGINPAQNQQQQFQNRGAGALGGALGGAALGAPLGPWGIAGGAVLGGLSGGGYF